MIHTELDDLIVFSWKLADLGSDKFDLYTKMIANCDEPLFDAFYLLKTCERILVASICLSSAYDNRSRHSEFCKKKNLCFITENIDPYPNLATDATIYTGVNAFRYLCSIAGSLDSSTIGEHEILGQFKKSFIFQQERKILTGSLSDIILEAYKTGKKVHTSSDIPKGRISILSNAEKLFNNWIETLHLTHDQPISIAIVGTGKMGRDAYKYFKDKYKSKLKVYSRNRTESIPVDLPTLAFESFETFEADLKKNSFNVLILCSTTNTPFITPNVLQNQNQMLIFDLGVPKNAAPSLNDMNEITLYQMDQLVQLSEMNYSIRANSLYQAYEIVDQQVNLVSKMFEKKLINPFIKELRFDLEKVAQKRLEDYTSNKELPTEFYKWFNNTIKEMMHVSQNHLEKNINLYSNTLTENEESRTSSFSLPTENKIGTN